MSEIKWDGIFEEEIERNPGLSEDDLALFVSSVLQPLTADELELPELQSDDLARWKIPEGTLPHSYISFLLWSNGGEFRNGDRLMQFFPALDPVQGVRIMMLAYGVPDETPGILPFAFNGGGIFYAFDMRFRPVNGEYSIVAAECGHPHNPFKLAPTFLKACQSMQSIEELWDKEDSIMKPMCSECGEFLVCPQCGRHGSAVHL